MTLPGNSLAVIAFFLAICGEFVSYKYNGRRDVLYQAQEQQVRDSAAGEMNRAHQEAAAKKTADSDQRRLTSQEHNNSGDR